MAYVPQYDDLNEQIGQFDFKTLAEQVNYNVISGCAATYSSSDLTVTVASGSITHNGSTVAVAGNAITLVPDPLAVNPRWAVIHANGSGTVAVTHGTAAAVPAKPDPGDVTILFAVKVAPGLTIAANATVKLDKRMPKVGGSVEGVDVLSTGVTDGYVLTADGADAAAWGAIPAPTAPITNYKTSTQSFTTNTTFADVAGADAATFAFAIGANEKWIAKYHIQVDFGGSGGLKLQLTGPSSPTLVRGYAKSTQIVRDSGTNGNVSMMPTAPFTAFSASIIAHNSVGTLSGHTKFYIQELNDGLTQNWVEVDVLIINGATAGTVTLQAAQNSSDSNTTLGTGCFMEARKIS